MTERLGRLKVMKKIVKALEEKKVLTIKEAIELCKKYGWEVSKGKYFLECDEDRVIFQNDKELIDYAEMLEKERN